MANYVSLDNLRLYDEKIKAKMASDDEAVLASAEAKAVSEAEAVQTKLDEEVARAKGREDQIEGLVTTAQNEINTLNSAVNTKATQTDLDALAGKVGEVPADQTVMGVIANIQENAYDDTDIRALISELGTNKADKTQVAIDIADAVEVETNARVEAIATVQEATNVAQNTANTAKAAIDAFLKEADATETAIDTLKEIQSELAQGEASAASMLAEINALKAVDNATQAELDDALVEVNASIESKADKSDVEETLAQIVNSAELCVENDKLTLKLGGVGGVAVNQTHIDMATDIDIDMIIESLDE